MGNTASEEEKGRFVLGLGTLNSNIGLLKHKGWRKAHIAIESLGWETGYLGRSWGDPVLCGEKRKSGRLSAAGRVCHLQLMRHC